MVTTCRDIITRAYRMAGGLRDQRRSLDGTDAALALADLQMLVLALPGMGHWDEVEITADYTAGENERVRVNTLDGVTVTIPAAVLSARKQLWCCNQTELVCEGYDDRAPKDGARVQIADVYSDASSVYFYRSDIAQWTQANGLALNSEVPLNADMDLYLSAMLAELLCLGDSQATPPTTQAIASEGRSKMRARYGKRQGVAADLALLRTSSNPELADG